MNFWPPLKFFGRRPAWPYVHPSSSSGPSRRQHRRHCSATQLRQSSGQPRSLIATDSNSISALLSPNGFSLKPRRARQATADRFPSLSARTRLTPLLCRRESRTTSSDRWCKLPLVSLSGFCESMLPSVHQPLRFRCAEAGQWCDARRAKDISPRDRTCFIPSNNNQHTCSLFLLPIPSLGEAESTSKPKTPAGRRYSTIAQNTTRL